MIEEIEMRNYVVNEWNKDRKYLGYWETVTLHEAQNIIDSLKISGVGKTFNIETKGGRVIKVVRK